MTLDIAKDLITQVREKLNTRSEMSDQDLKQYIESLVFEKAELHGLTTNRMKSLIERVYNAFRGLDVLQPLIDDPSVTEIMINSAEEIFIEKDGAIFQANVQFESSERLEDIIQMIVGKVNRTVNASTPIVDARLEDGSRVNIVLPPIA